MNNEQKTILKKINEKSKVFADDIKEDIYSLCEISDYKQSSNISYLIDRIDLFIETLKEVNEINSF